MTRKEHEMRRWLMNRARNEVIITLSLLKGTAVNYGRLSGMTHGEAIQACINEIRMQKEAT